MIKKITDRAVRPLRSLYDKVLALSAHPRATVWLMIVAFTESIFFPIPQDVMLIPMMLANRKKAFFYATMCLIASVAGGIAGYFIGAYLYVEIAEPILYAYGYMEQMAKLKVLYAEHGWWFVVGGGLTPVPYKVITITSGALELSLMSFIAAAVVSRMIRFYALAILTYYFGEKILKFIDKYFGLLSVLFFALVIGGFFLIKLII